MMELSDILKYSQQFIAQFPNKEQLIFNGFFVKYDDFYYIITVNHGVAPDLKQAEKVYLVLHANTIGISTRVSSLDKWQFIDLYDCSQEKGKFIIPRFKDRVDFAFCGIQRGDIKQSQERLPFLLEDADDVSCRHKSFSCIILPQNKVIPSNGKKYYVAGKILKHKDAIHEEYKTLYFYDMEYFEDFEGIYGFKIKQETSYEECHGLSGSPVFDEDEKFVGMAVRYREEDNVLRVLPAEVITDYLHNDCTPSLEEMEYYKLS